MNLCRTCMYALYDGMCLAHGKFTLLDAPACDDYKMRVNVEVSKLKAENVKLRELAESRGWIARMLVEQSAMVVDLEELVADMWSYINAPVNQRNNLKERLAIYDDLADRMRELGVMDG